MKVKDLKNLAKERGFHGYSRLRNAELISLLSPAPIRAPRNKRRDFSERPVPASRTKRRDERPVPAPRNILDIKNPEINVPILVPEIVKTKPNTAKKFIEETVTTVNDWINWLKESGKNFVKKTPPKVKEFIENIQKLNQDEFKVIKGKSALKKFARQFTISEKPGYEPQTFLSAVKNLIIPILKKNEKTKVKFILKCKMQRTDLAKETIESDVDFHSQIEVNLAGTNVNELYAEMIARILENIANFQRRGSNWQFAAINQLEIHLVDYVPLRGSSYFQLKKNIADKKAVLNIKNYDDLYFKWCVTRRLNPVKKKCERITKELKNNLKN